MGALKQHLSPEIFKEISALIDEIKPDVNLLPDEEEEEQVEAQKHK